MSQQPSKDLKSHWNKTYEKIEINKLGWHEENPEPSLRLIKKCGLSKNATVLNVGSGASSLIDELLKAGYKNIIASDISASALEKLKQRLGEEQKNVRWIVDDLTNPIKLSEIEPVDIWHDRAVLHFFNEPEEQNTYFNLLKKLVKIDGFVIIATFNLNGAEKCSGLPVFRYNKEMLQVKLGQDFKLIEAFDHTYIMPSGDTREYVYAFFKKIN